MSCIGCGGFSNRPEKIKVHCFACCQVTGSLSVQEQQLQIAAREVALIQAETWWHLCHWPTFGCVSCGFLCTGNAKHCSLGRMGACTVCDVPNFFSWGTDDLVALANLTSPPAVRQLNHIAQCHLPHQVSSFGVSSHWRPSQQTRAAGKWRSWVLN